MTSRTIFVMGVGRSGTSTVAGVLKSLGVEWGPEDLMMPAAEGNTRGFWEFLPLYEINIEILNRLGGDWHSPPEFPPGWEESEALADLRTKAQEAIAEHFHTDLWGFKDPRSCLTFPFWRLVIKNPIDCVFTFRNPLEVAYSLLHRDSFPVENGIALWLQNVVESWTATHDLRRHCVFYEDILNNPPMEIARIERFLGKESSTEEKSKAVAFVGHELRHQQVRLDELFRQESVPPLVKALYAALRQFVHSQRVGSDEGLYSVDYLVSKCRRFKDALTSCAKPDPKLLSTYQPPPPSGR